MSIASRQRLLRLAPALLGIFGAVYIVLVAIYSRPVGDDWWHIVYARDSSLASEFQKEWLGGSDRFSGTVLLIGAIRLFGTSAVNITPIVLLLLLWALAALILRQCTSLTGRFLPWFDASALALLAVVAVVATAPSVYDTVGWFSGVVIYLAAVVSACAAGAWCLHAAAADPTHWRRSVAVAFALGAITAGFHEVVGTIVVLAALLGAVTARSIVTRAHRRCETFTLLATATGAAVGIVVNLLGPGTRQRSSGQHAHVSLSAAAHTASHNLSFLRDDTHNGVLLLALATGVVGRCRSGSQTTADLVRVHAVRAMGGDLGSHGVGRLDRVR